MLGEAMRKEQERGFRMLKSMTGFGAGDRENDSYRIHVEIRAVNQRFLEVSFRMPRCMFAWEDAMRKCIKKSAARGKLEVQIVFEDKREQAASIRVNRGLALAYQKALNELSDLLHVARADDIAAVAAYPDILSVEENRSMEGLEEILLPALEDALQGLNAMRCKEGEHLEQDFSMRLEILEHLTDEVEVMAPSIVADYRKRIEKTLSELLSAEEIDETRIIQETAIYADRVNFTEEIVRLRSHFAQFRSIQQEAGEPVGRKLDFLMQEMNREANTIGSKANQAAAARIVVEMKSEIEKLREQVQNIE